MPTTTTVRGRGAGRGAYGELVPSEHPSGTLYKTCLTDLVWPLGALTEGFPGYAAGYAAVGRASYPGYAGFGYPFAGITI